jgi:hypothetical protein
MGCLGGGTSVFAEIEVAFAVFPGFDLEVVVEEGQQVAFQSIDLKRCVGSNYLGERVVL